MRRTGIGAYAGAHGGEGGEGGTEGTGRKAQLEALLGLRLAGVSLLRRGNEHHEDAPEGFGAVRLGRFAVIEFHLGVRMTSGSTRLGDLCVQAEQELEQH